jgi:hypothetical protein
MEYTLVIFSFEKHSFLHYSFVWWIIKNYETVAGEKGAQLSSVERQRICIGDCRVFYL